MDKKLANKKQKNLLWIDLEMTGLDANRDLIVEIAAIVTDWEFKEIATFEGVVKNESGAFSERMKLNALFWDANSASRDGLTALNAQGKSLADVEDDILGFINKHFEVDAPVLLAGNSIHIDRRFITNYWTRLDARLHYRMLDVSAWKVVFEAKFKKKFSKPEEHRALSDIRGSIMELKYYLEKVKA